MPTTLKRGRRLTVLITVVAMVASMVGIAAPAGALVSAACPADTPSAGFTDLAGVPTDAVDAIDCIARYGVSTGTSATTFSPFNTVERWQMALFLTRSATTMGISLPSGASGPFTDLAGVPAAAVTAINQIAELGISTGTSATTFSPFANVERWQMALFLTRLLVKDGVTLGDGASGPFTDLAGVPANAVTAINQIAALGVSTGTSATTFSPFDVVERWAMALFLARSLDEAGVTPPEGQVSVSPSTAGTLPQGSARAYTATFRNQNGTLYTNQIGIQLVTLEADGTPDYNDATAPVAVIEQVDGVAAGGMEFNGFPGLDGAVTFIVRAGGTNESVVPVVWMDLDADGTYETTGDVAPTEPFALGGSIVISNPPAEAADGDYTGLTVLSVNIAGNSYVAGVAPGNTFNYDSNDILLLEGNLVTEAQFEAALSEQDVVTVTDYDDADASVVTFNIVTDNTPTAGLTVTTPAAATQVDAQTFTIQGTGQAGQVVTIYVDTNNDGNKDSGEPAVGSGTVAANGTWSVSVPLTQNTVNNFTATQASTVGGAANDSGVDVPAITEGAAVAAVINSAVGANVAPSAAGTLGPNDTITITFSEAIAGVGSGDTVSIVDQDGSTATLTLGPDVGSALSAGDTVLTLTINTLVFASGGGTAGIQPAAQITAISGFQGADGLAINVAGSGSGRVFTGF